MKKIFVFIISIILGVGFVYADEEVKLEVISVSTNSITLEVCVNNSNKEDVCYLYRSLDGISYEEQIIIDCNSMYVDKNLDSGVTYYYKARYSNIEKDSNIVKVDIEEKKDDTLKISRDVKTVFNNGIVYFSIFGGLMIITLIYMYLFKKKKFTN